MYTRQDGGQEESCRERVKRTRFRLQQIGLPDWVWVCRPNVQCLRSRAYLLSVERQNLAQTEPKEGRRDNFCCAIQPLL